jgi:hypothetical protein
MMPEDGPEPLMIRHKRAQWILGCGASFYWRLVQEGRIKVLGSGRASRADYASIKAYYRSLQAEAEKAA